ncbi:hypothetical protein I4U23_016606 [Adineta vaga]|nr:hypothetical protein I4U23_016606 [Adineta vaga]
MVDVIYDTLEIIDEILRNANIKYVIFGGTMLGSQRHGGLIPWDDDADIAIHRNDEEKLSRIFDIEPLFGYRVWDPRRTVLQVRYQLYAPFVDIFLIDIKDNRYVYITEKAIEMFPGEPLPFDCFDRLIDVPFGHLTLCCLNADDTQRYLNETYGSDWNKIAWRDYDHLTGDILPKICIPLDRPELLQPTLHSQHTEIKRLPSSTTTTTST